MKFNFQLHSGLSAVSADLVLIESHRNWPSELIDHSKCLSGHLNF